MDDWTHFTRPSSLRCSFGDEEKPADQGRCTTAASQPNSHKSLHSVISLHLEGKIFTCLKLFGKTNQGVKDVWFQSAGVSATQSPVSVITDQ